MGTGLIISTGSYYKSGLDQNESIKRIQELSNEFNIVGVEIIIPNFDSFEKMKFEDSVVDFLNKLDKNSIHMPTTRLSDNPSESVQNNYDGSEKVKSMVENANLLINKLNIKKVVLHPHDIQSFNYLSKINCELTIENMNGKKWKKCNTVEETKQFLNENPMFKLTFDPSHAIKANISPEKFLSLKDKIKSIQLGYQENDEYILLKDLDEKKREEYFGKLKNLDIDYIVEEELNKTNDESEIRFIQNYFSN